MKPGDLVGEIQKELTRLGVALVTEEGMSVFRDLESGEPVLRVLAITPSRCIYSIPEKRQ